MIKFDNGPAHGVTLSLMRAPFLLRVTHKTENGKDVFDALDQLSDTAEPDESLFLYQAKPKPFGVAFIDGTRDGRRCGWQSMVGEYEYVAEQPDDATMRDNVAWSSWCDQRLCNKKHRAEFRAFLKANRRDFDE